MSTNLPLGVASCASVFEWVLALDVPYDDVEVVVDELVVVLVFVVVDKSVVEFVFFIVPIVEVETLISMDDDISLAASTSITTIINKS